MWPVLGGPILQSPVRRIDVLIRILLDPLVLALVLGSLLALFLLSLEIVTVLYVWGRERRDQRRAAKRPVVREELFERLAAGDADWESWAAGLDEMETEVARDLVDTYLRSVRGQEHDRLQDAGRALDIPDEAVAMLEYGDRPERLRALTWLTLLEHPVDPDRLQEHCSDDPMVRAAAARLMAATGGPERASLGTELLLSVPDEPLTSFGIDTLHELHREEPAGLFEFASESAEDWSATVTTQVLRVCREYTNVDRDVPTDWLVPLFEHERSSVRAAAVGAFEGLGWRPGLRDLLPHESVVDDPAPDVRRTYAAVLASWNDEDALARLRDLARSDPAPRVRLAAAKGLPGEMLPEAGLDIDGDTGERDPVHEWVRAERAARPGGVGS